MIALKRYVFLFFLLFIPVNVFADTAHASIVMDLDSDRIVYANNIHEKKLIASTTKIMTCLIVLENNNLNSKVVVGDEILSMYGTNIYVEVGEELTVKDLLYGLMLRSGNDAAITLAVNTSGSEEKFVEMMNKKAHKLGMKDTIFNNSHGLDEESQNYSTAYDMALLSKYAYQNKIYRKIIGTKKYIASSSLKTYTWYNRMSLINNYKYALGGKNGYTPKAGKTLVSIAKKNNTKLTIVSLDDSDIYNNHKELYTKYFNIYKKYIIIDKKNFRIDSSLVGKDIYIKKSFSYLLSNDEINDVNTIIKIGKVKKNNSVGKVLIMLNDKKVGELGLYQRKRR